MAHVQFVGQIIYRFSKKLHGLLVKQDNVWECVLSLIDSSLAIVVCKKIMVLFYHSLIIVLQATVEDENLCLLKLANVGPGILLMCNESEQLVQAVTHVKTRWQLSQPVSLYRRHSLL